MRRTLFAVPLSVAFIVQLSTAALASGPGGWNHVGHGATSAASALNGAVYALATDSSGITLYAGGAFTNAGGKAAADHIAKWNGVAWSALSSVTLNGNVRAIAVHAGKVYVGGNFINVGGNGALDYLAEWNGTSWSSPCNVPNSITAAVLALQIIGSTLYIGGSFADGAGITSADFLLACDLTTGTPSSTVLGDGYINSGISALTADSNGVLYAGGSFINMAHVTGADHIASYDGAWHAMGGMGAVDDKVRSLAANGTNVYVGTDAVNIDGIARADHVAKWNGSAWSAMGSNTAGTDGWFPASSFIYAMSTSGQIVFAAGSFQNANGDPTADRIAYFDGSAWHPLGSDGAGNGPMNAAVDALTSYLLSVCAGGEFTNAGGDGLADGLGCYLLLRPDARIGTHLAGPFAGNNVYSASGAGEAKTISVPRGHRGTLYADVQNDGLFTDTFKVHGTGAARGFTVSYFKGTTNVTAQVAAGTFSTGSLAPGAHVTLKVVVKVAASSANTGTFLVKATSPGPPADSVKVIVKAT